MKNERSAGAVIFNRCGNSSSDQNIEYLILKYPQKHWGFARGHVEPGENDLQAAKREIKEETGLSQLRFVRGFREISGWTVQSREDKSKNVFKDVIYFLAESRSRRVVLSSEHNEFRWLRYSQALKMITFSEGKDILKKANSYLLRHKNYAGRKMVRDIG